MGLFFCILPSDLLQSSSLAFIKSKIRSWGVFYPFLAQAGGSNLAESYTIPIITLLDHSNLYLIQYNLKLKQQPLFFIFSCHQAKDEKLHNFKHVDFDEFRLSIIKYYNILTQSQLHIKLIDQMSVVCGSIWTFFIALTHRI